MEEAISAAVNNGDFLPFEDLLTVLPMPYEAAMPIRRGPIKSCTKRFAALDHGMGTASVLVCRYSSHRSPRWLTL